MYSFKRKFTNNSEAIELGLKLNSREKEDKKRVKEIIKGFEAFYIVPDHNDSRLRNGKVFSDYAEVINDSDEHSILLLTYREYEKLTSNNALKNIIQTKIVYDLQRGL